MRGGGCQARQFIGDGSNLAGRAHTRPGVRTFAIRTTRTHDGIRWACDCSAQRAPLPRAYCCALSLICRTCHTRSVHCWQQLSVAASQQVQGHLAAMPVHHRTLQQQRQRQRCRQQPMRLLLQLPGGCCCWPTPIMLGIDFACGMCVRARTHLPGASAAHITHTTPHSVHGSCLRMHTYPTQCPRMWLRRKTEFVAQQRCACT